MREVDATYAACAIKTMAAIFKEFANRGVELQQNSLRRDLRTLFEIENYRRICGVVDPQAFKYYNEKPAYIEQPTLDFLFNMLESMQGPLVIKDMITARRGWQHVIEQDKDELPKEGGHRVRSELEALSNVFFSVGPIIQYAASDDPDVVKVVTDIVQSAMAGTYANLESNLRLASIAYDNAKAMDLNTNDFEKTKKEAFEGIYGNGLYERLKKCIKKLKDQSTSSIRKGNSKADELSVLEGFAETASDVLNSKKARDELIPCLARLAALDGDQYKEVQKLAHDAVYGEDACDALNLCLSEIDEQINNEKKYQRSKDEVDVMKAIQQKVKEVLMAQISYDELRKELKKLSRFNGKTYKDLRLRRAAHDAAYEKKCLRQVAGMCQKGR